ncbi:hypothetical protein EDD22DRAFT_828503, partial [Suillus occidentalis]
SSTHTKECKICEREEQSTYYYHHLIPRSTHAKVLKNDKLRWSGLRSHLWLLCTPCHSAVHSYIASDSDDKVTVAPTQLTSSYLGRTHSRQRLEG